MSQGRGGRGGGGGGGRGGAPSGGRGGGYTQGPPAPAGTPTATGIQFELPQPAKNPSKKYSSIVKVQGKRLTNCVAMETQKRATKPAVGDKVELIMNRYRVEMKESYAHTLYRVDITPDVPAAGKRAKVVYLAFEKISGNDKVVDDNLLQFDSGNLVLQFQGQPLVKDDKGSVQVMLEKRGGGDHEQFKVDIKLTTYHRDPNPFQAFGVAFAAGISSEGKVSIRGKYYNPATAIQVPEHKCELLPGVDMSLFTTETGVHLQVDQVYKHIRTDTILDLLRDGRTRPEHLEGKIGMCTYLMTKNKATQTFDITEIITSKNPDTMKFTTKDGETNMTNYLKKKYNLNVTDRTQPIIKYLTRKTNRREPETKYFLPEFSRLAGETDSMKTDGFRRRELIKRTAAPPQERMGNINRYMVETSTPRFQASLQKYGIKLSPKMLKFPGVVMASPPLKFNEAKTIQGHTWETVFRERSLPLYRTTPIKKLAIIGADDMTAGFVNTEMEQVRNQFKFEIQEYEYIPADRQIRTPDDMRKKCEEVAKKGFDFIYIILERANEHLYVAAKRVLAKAGIPSQVFTKFNVQKAALTKATKITIQVVTKAGGAPWAAKLPFTVPTMTFGLAMHSTKDTFHQDKKDDTTMGALVASINSVLSDYYSVPILIRGKTQVFTPFKGSLSERLKMAIAAFKQKNKDKQGKELFPEQLIVYRDGGAEGDYSDILKQEVEEFKRVAAETAAESKRPCVLTFVLVFKKTGARIFTDKYENPKPGTVVEKYITSTALQEFYLQSNTVDQGSASATKYVVLYDDSTIEGLPAISFAATHCYYNWNSTIPTPAPLKYAEKLAAFAGGILGTDDVNQALRTRLYYL